MVVKNAFRMSSSQFNEQRQSTPVTPTHGNGLLLLAQMFPQVILQTIKNWGKMEPTDLDGKSGSKLQSSRLWSGMPFALVKDACGNGHLTERSLSMTALVCLALSQLPSGLFSHLLPRCFAPSQGAMGLTVLGTQASNYLDHFHPLLTQIRKPVQRWTLYQSCFSPSRLRIWLSCQSSCLTSRRRRVRSSEPNWNYWVWCTSW